MAGLAADRHERPQSLGTPRLSEERVTTRERSVILGLRSLRLFAFVSRDGIAPRKPTAEVDVGAPSRTKWPKSLDRWPATARTRLHLMSPHWIAHAANIGTARRKGKGPVAKPASDRSAQGLRRGQRSPAHMAAAIPSQPLGRGLMAQGEGSASASYPFTSCSQSSVIPHHVSGHKPREPAGQRHCWSGAHILVV